MLFSRVPEGGISLTESPDSSVKPLLLKSLSKSTVTVSQARDSDQGGSGTLIGSSSLRLRLSDQPEAQHNIILLSGLLYRGLSFGFHTQLMIC
eukprot:3593813-Rhodomonas_salina.2